jgi:hypothetical protein
MQCLRNIGSAWYKKFLVITTFLSKQDVAGQKRYISNNESNKSLEMQISRKISDNRNLMLRSIKPAVELRYK